MRNLIDYLIARAADHLGYVPRTELDAETERRLNAERRFDSAMRGLRELNEKASFGRLRRLGDVHVGRSGPAGGRVAEATYALRPPKFAL